MYMVRGGKLAQYHRVIRRVQVGVVVTPLDSHVHIALDSKATLPVLKNITIAKN